MTTTDQDWYIDATCTLSAPLDADDALTITEQLAHVYAVAALADNGTRLELSMTVQAPNAVSAATRARAVVYSLELAQVDTITALEIRTEAERARQLAEPTVPELVGTSEIADMAGVSRQQVFYLAKRPGFPIAVQKISGRVLRRRDAVEHWLSTRRHERSEQSAPAGGDAVPGECTGSPKTGAGRVQKTPHLHA
ncbi:hypothetical protein AABM35_12625 (plasmid) [Micrococcus luteus]|uniref:helix-turn-helix transcriptional regulator n=1 Tax=Micrococcus luteus TaxID=1270 RepID=UPI003C2D35B4